MSNPKLDPRSLNAEERAIVDMAYIKLNVNEVQDLSRRHRPDHETLYGWVLSHCEPMILARYDEAIRLLREAQVEILEGVDMDESQAACDIEVFLDAEGKVAG